MKKTKDSVDVEISPELLRKLESKCAEKGELVRARVEGLIKIWLREERSPRVKETN